MGLMENLLKLHHHLQQELLHQQHQKSRSKRRKNNKVSIVQQHCQRDKSDSISEDVSVTDNVGVPEAAGGSKEAAGAASREATGEIAAESNDGSQDLAQNENQDNLPIHYKLE